ncbi:AGAP003703-PA-like protein [Anopheles sinensis]|uniref:AGAP003703-PA-like protein n=1 Tax=Anopheles sinensis TaxID=74873 RepID=A0A084WL69_ANOSI|nr:AGAP003703-PA-like protein [Anopheles sinensis]
MEPEKRMPSKGPSSLVSWEERASTTAAAALNGVTPQRVRTDPSSPPSRSTTLSAITAEEKAENPHAATPVGMLGVWATQDIRPKPSPRNLGGADRIRREKEIRIRMAILDLDLQLLKLETEKEEEEYLEGGQEDLSETLGCGTEAPHGEEAHASQPVVLFATTGCPPAGSGEDVPDAPRDDMAALLEWRRAIDAKVRASAMAESINAPAMAHKMNNNATEKGHASGMAHSLDTLASHGNTATTSTLYIGFTAPTGHTAHTATHYGPTTQTIHASNIGHTALSTHTTPSSQTAATKHSSFLGNTSPRNGTDAYTFRPLSSVPHMKDEEKFDWATSARLREVTVSIQRRFRANRLMERQMEVYSRQKCAAVVIQRWFRGYRAMIEVRDRFIAIRQAAVALQQRFRAHAAIVLELLPDFCGAILSAAFSSNGDTMSRAPTTKDLLRRASIVGSTKGMRCVWQSWWHGGNHRKRFLALLLSELFGRTPMMAENSLKDALRSSWLSGRMHSVACCFFTSVSVLFKV